MGIQTTKIIKVCPVCRRQFTPKHSNQIYCGLVCQDEARRARRSAWIEANPFYYRDYMRNRRKDCIGG